jgi:hypothetical protein
MATRASIKFKDSDGRFIANVYHHYDGYPSGLGAKLLELTEGVVVNGLGRGEYLGKRVFNGFGCLAASVIEGLKGGNPIGNVYLYSESEYGNAGEEYLYEVVELENGCNVFVKSLHADIGTGDEFVPVEDVLEAENNV